MDVLNGGEQRNCFSCGKPVKGRTDKKFCNDYCRNNFNNQLKRDEAPLVKNINNILRKNRRILETLIRSGESTANVMKSRLLEAGFNFRYFTHIYMNKKGLVYHFCYEYGYMMLEGDWILIVRRK